MKRVLQLSTYPVKNPLHGGQIRVSEIAKFLREQGCEVKSISISETSHQSYDSEDDMLVLAHQLQSEISTPFCTDYATFLLSSKGEYYQFIKNHILEFKPDIILIEQAWLWGAVKKLKEENLLNNTKIYYSSHNIEYKTKEGILTQHRIDKDEIKNVVEKIKAMESDLVQNSDGVIACTREDAKILEELGAKSVIIAPNGVAKIEVSDEAVERVRGAIFGRKYAFFVGSAYPPNAIGFWEMLGDSIAWLPPEYLIVVAGGVGAILKEYQPENSQLFDHVSFDRIKRVGFLPQDILNAFIYESSLILLPITVGGGSNLKTAEAIASNRAVVATKTACRGFEFTKELTDFAVVETQDEFINETLKFLKRDSITLISKDEREIREQVYWQNCLKELSKIC